jgi:hypothetical protein
MTRLERPLGLRRLRATGEIVLRAELDLTIKTNLGTWVNAVFLVDSGMEMTTMWAATAKEWDLPIPRRPVPRFGLHGQEVRAGLLRARIVGMDLTEYVFPCYFIREPSTPPPPTAKNLLGLTGVIDRVRLTFDGATAPGVPYGVLIVEKR